MPDKSTVYLIPIPIAEGAVQTLSPEIYTYTQQVTYYFVENIRTARRFLKAIHPTIVIDDLHFSEIDKHAGADKQVMQQWLQQGNTIGIMSEAGCPGIADPGAELVAMAHAANATIVPLTGPSSILLALMASGLNGQKFCFHGYLPVKDPMRSQEIKQLEQQSQKEQQTQLFIETPYRNNQLLADLLKNLHPNTRLCIAMHITAPTAYIHTQTVAEWKKNVPVLEKAPAVFLMLG